MKQTALALFLSIISVAPLLADDATPAATAQGTNNPSPFNNEKDRASYALGMMIGHNWQQQGVDVNFDIFTKGFKDEQSGGVTKLTPQEMRETLTAYQKVIAEKQQKKREAQAAEDEKKSEAFLAENKTKPGVKTLEDGLQYKIVTEGTGDKPGTDDIVTVNYRGTLIDGTEFDSSYKRGKPAQFQLKQVIPGWREALQMMKVGAKWDIYIPANLAYGKSGRPGIPPDSALIFEVELLGAKAPPPPAKASNAPLTSDIIAVPSAAELKAGKKPYTLKPEDVKKLEQEYKTNSTAK